VDFESVFRLLLETFEKNHFRYALIGGWAVAAAGHHRATQDIDFLLQRDDYPAVKAFLSGFGYELLNESGDVANFAGKLKELGQVDFLLAHRPYALAMLDRAIRRPILDRKFVVPVLQPEDLIGLKLQSIVNDPARAEEDRADIEALLRLNAKELHWELIEEYFTILNKKDEFHALRQKFLDPH